MPVGQRRPGVAGTGRGGFRPSGDPPVDPLRAPKPEDMQQTLKSRPVAQGGPNLAEIGPKLAGIGAWTKMRPKLVHKRPISTPHTQSAWVRRRSSTDFGQTRPGIYQFRTDIDRTCTAVSRNWARVRPGSGHTTRFAPERFLSRAQRAVAREIAPEVTFELLEESDVGGGLASPVCDGVERRPCEDGGYGGEMFAQVKLGASGGGGQLSVGCRALGSSTAAQTVAQLFFPTNLYECGARCWPNLARIRPVLCDDDRSGPEFGQT